MVLASDLTALDVMLDQFIAKPYDARSQPKMGQLRGFAVGCIRISSMHRAVHNV
jgi:hypothetical protein